MSLIDPALKFLLGRNATLLVEHYKVVKIATMKIGELLQMYIGTKLPPIWVASPTGLDGKPDFHTTDGKVRLQVKNSYNSSNSSHKEVYDTHDVVRWHRMNKDGSTNWPDLCKVLGVKPDTYNEADFLKYLGAPPSPLDKFFKL